MQDKDVKAINELCETIAQVVIESKNQPQTFERILAELTPPAPVEQALRETINDLMRLLSVTLRFNEAKAVAVERGLPLDKAMAIVLNKDSVQ